MRNILIVLRSNLSKDELVTWTEGRGGEWNYDPTLDQGVLLKNGAAIYVSYFNPGAVYGERDSAALERILGVIPTAGVDIHIGHAEGSEALAYEFAQKTIDQWGGFLDENVDEIT